MWLLKRLPTIVVTVLGARFLNAILDVLQIDPMPYLVRRVISAPTDTWIEMFRWLAALLVALTILGVIWLWKWWHREKVPIAVSRIELRSGGYAGFSDERDKDAWIESFGDVTITNISATNKVSLDIWLHATGEKLRIKTLADLSGPFGLILGKDDQGSKGWEKIGREPQVFFRSPVVLAPQETARRRLAFLHNYADLNNPILLARIKGKVTFEIEIIDHVSGGSIRIPIPGEYRA